MAAFRFRITDARGRTVRVLDPVALHLLRRYTVIPQGPLQAIAEKADRKWARRGYLIAAVLVLGLLACYGGSLGYHRFVRQTSPWSAGTYFFWFVQLVWFAGVFAVLWYLGKRSRLHRVPGVMLEYGWCPHCGYSLRGLSAEGRDGLVICPECGCAWRMPELRDDGHVSPTYQPTDDSGAPSTGLNFMRYTCPNCHSGLPFMRTFFTTAWGRFRCGECGSLLGIDARRRFLAVFLMIPVIFLGFWVSRRAGLNDALVVLVAIGVPFVCVGFFDRAVAFERRGVHCRQCGYDLQGQQDPRCPECGQELNEDERKHLGMTDPSRVVQPTGRKALRGRRIAIAVLIIMGLAVTAGLGLTVYMRRTGWVTAPNIDPVVQRLCAYATNHAGRGPHHPIELVGVNGSAAELFISFDALTVPERVPLADTTLAAFDASEADRRRSLIDTADDGMPNGVSACRLGDYVFSHYGMDFNNADKDLWIVVWAPDPAQNSPPSPDEYIPIGLADGRVIHVLTSKFEGALKAQNQLRADHSLPPLPSPFLLPHAAPTVAPASY